MTKAVTLVYLRRISIAMTIIRIELLQGRTSAVKAELVARVTDVVATTLRVDAEQVRVLLYELPPEHWAVGGQPKRADFVDKWELRYAFNSNYRCRMQWTGSRT
jgi:4-oxalocrotonate tautomerase